MALPSLGLAKEEEDGRTSSLVFYCRKEPFCLMATSHRRAIVYGFFRLSRPFDSSGAALQLRTSIGSAGF